MKCIIWYRMGVGDGPRTLIYYRQIMCYLYWCTRRAITVHVLSCLAADHSWETQLNFDGPVISDMLLHVHQLGLPGEWVKDLILSDKLHPDTLVSGPACRPSTVRSCDVITTIQIVSPATNTNSPLIHRTTWSLLSSLLSLTKPSG